MKTEVRLIDEVISDATSLDGEHLALRLRDIYADEFTLAIPVVQVGRIVEICARSLGAHAQRSDDIDSKLVGTKGVFAARWWNMTRGKSDAVVLTITLASGGTLGFVLPRHMSDTMLKAVMTEYR